MKAIVLLITCAASAAANSCVAQASANWSANPTWTSCGGSHPGNGDTASIGAFNVTVDVNTTVGTSPANDTTAAVTVSSGTLTIAGGVTLTYRGAITCSQNATTGDWLIVQAGGSMLHDSSAAASPGTTYYHVGAGITNMWRNIHLEGMLASGTSWSSVTTGGAAGGTLIYDEAGSYANPGSIIANWTAFSNLGSATVTAIKTNDWSSLTWNVQNSTFNKVGLVQITGVNYCGSGTTFIHNNNVHTNSMDTNTYSSFTASMIVDGYSGTGCQMSGDYFDATVEAPLGLAGFAINDTAFMNALNNEQDSYTLSSFERNLVRSNFGGINMALGGVLTDKMYFVGDTEAIRHLVNLYDNPNCYSVTLQKSIVEFTGVQVNVPGGAADGDGVLAGVIGSCGGSATGSAGSSGLSTISYSSATQAPSIGQLVRGTGIPSGALIASVNTGAGTFSISPSLTTGAVSGTIYYGSLITTSYNLFIPGPTNWPFNINLMYGALYSAGSGSNGNGYGSSITDHNTNISGSSPSGMILSPGYAYFGEGQNPAAGGTPWIPAGAISSFRSNLFWDTAQNSPIMQQWNNGGNIPAMPSDIIDRMDYNWKFNALLTLGGGYNYTNQGCGYAGNWSVTPCTAGGKALHDHTGTAAAYNPNFLNQYRNFTTAASQLYGDTATAGVWTSGSSYTVGQVVSFTNSGYYNGTLTLWRCIQNNTASAANMPGLGTLNTVSPPAQTAWRTYWEPETVYNLQIQYQNWIAAGATGVSPSELLREWVWYGWVPQNPATWTASAEGTSVGATQSNLILLPMPIRGIQ